MVFHSILFEETEDSIQKETLQDPAPSGRFRPSPKKKMEIPPLDKLHCPKCRKQTLRHYGKFTIFCLSCGASYKRDLNLMIDAKIPPSTHRQLFKGCLGVESNDFVAPD